MVAATSPTGPCVAGCIEELELQLLGGRALRGLRCGRRGGQPWLLLHGWLDNAAAFAPLLPLLREELGPDVDLVALDMAGHGRSDHLGEGYLLVDYAADVLLAADSLGWGTLSLLGHSLGGYVASIAAGTQPERVARLVLLDIIGPNGRQAEEAPSVLAKSISWVAERSTGSKAGGSRLKVFGSVEEAAKQRADKNIGGPMSLSNALLIASRGVVAADASASPMSGWTPSFGGSSPTASSADNESCVSGYVWASDPRLLQPSQQELTPEVAAAFLKQIRCPSLVLIATDGIYRDLLKRGGRWHAHPGGNALPLTHAFGRPFCAYLVILWVSLRLASRLMSWLRLPAKQRQLETVARHVREGWRVGARLRALKRFQYEELPSGGHHFHMTCPEDTSRAIVSWFRSSS